MVVMARTLVPSWLLGQLSNCRASGRLKENRDNPCGRVSVLQVTFGVYIPERRVCRSPGYVGHGCVPAPPWRWWQAAICGAMVCAFDTNNKCHKTNIMCHAEWNIFFFLTVDIAFVKSPLRVVLFFCVCVCATDFFAKNVPAWFLKRAYHAAEHCASGAIFFSHTRTRTLWHVWMAAYASTCWEHLIVSKLRSV